MYKYLTLTAKNKFYLYDGVSGNIFEIDEFFYANHREIFRYYINGGFESASPKIKEKILELKYAIDNGLIVEINSENSQFWFDEKEYLESYNSNIGQLMIGMTEKCNMRCKYCVYSGHYENERTHSCKSITTDQLFRAIDYYYKNSKGDKKIINFYGGEPFINFNGIKLAVDYIKSFDNDAQFYITTNATLLTDDIIEWFSNNKNVILYISLAGDPITHDQLRVFKNNLPTFDVIKKNIIKLKEIDFEAFSKRVHFIFNIFDDIQLLEIENFWKTDEIFSGNNYLPEITYIDLFGHDGTIERLSEDILSNFSATPQNLLEEYISRVKNGELNNIVVSHYDNKFLRIHRRSDNTQNIYAGVCRPFSKKMFVDVDGNVHVCENFVNGKDFGTIKDDINIEKISSLLEKYKDARKDDCAKCWASKLCSLCYRDIIDNSGDVNKVRAKKLCDCEKTSIINLLEQYCVLIDEGLSLDHLNEYEIYN